MSRQPNRLPRGGRIDRSKPLTFSFDGRQISGFAGDTIASALLANDIHLVARSFKFHRPRGIMAAGMEEANALLTIGSNSRGSSDSDSGNSNCFPNMLATTTAARNGLEARAQNAWPSLRFDLMAVNNILAPLFSTGFYYKTFMGPGRGAWSFYEHFIRRAAGMGKAAMTPDPARYEKVHLFCDCLIVGAGPAGLAAAWHGAKNGARVVLADRQEEIGGMLLDEADASEAAQWLQEMRASLAAMPNVTIMTSTEVFGAYDGNNFGLLQEVTPIGAPLRMQQPRQRYCSLRCTSAIIATGSSERPIAFANNDLPGIMLAGAIRTYIKRYAVLPGRRIVFFTNNDSAYLAALAAGHAGAAVSLIDCRADGPSELTEKCSSAGITILRSCCVAEAIGRRRIRAVKLKPVAGANAALGKADSTPPQQLDCDLLGLSGGWNPLIQLAGQSGGKAVFDDLLACFKSAPGPAGHAGHHVIGSAAGIFDSQGCIASGNPAAASSSVTAGTTADMTADLAFSGGDPPWQQPLKPLWAVPQASSRQHRKSFVDFQHDVKLSDISLAHLEGFVSVEHLKRYTTLGMALDQGRTSNVVALAVMAKLREQSIEATGTTSFRPPTSPITIGALAGDATGRHYRPARLTPMHDWHKSNGAVFTEAGLWLRAQYYPQQNEDIEDAYSREAAEVRKTVGLVDVSTLGKMDIAGPDAGEFLERIYMNGFATLAIGKARYGVMLRDDGFVFDDGTVSRIDQQHYFVTTTTAEAAPVLARLEFLLQCQWRDLKVHVTSVTDQWAAMALAGPRSRNILKALIKDIDFANDAFPHMGVRHGSLQSMPVHLLRVSFSGELAYELYTPAGFGHDVWQCIHKSAGVLAYGTEAMSALRIEKGFAAAAEIDGRTTPYDLGLLTMASKTKAFVGSALLKRQALSGAHRPSLVGLQPLDSKDRLRAGAILCEPGQHSGHGISGHGISSHGSSHGIIGHVSSRSYSPACGHDIALGFVKGGSARIGDVVEACSPLFDEVIRVAIVAPCFYDKAGERSHD